MNRSQQWHTDLLRGHYSAYLSDVSPWGDHDLSCIKALLYLQGGKSLTLVPQTHITTTPLNDDELARLAESMTPIQLELDPGDVVMMDIRLLHRGSSDEEMLNPRLADEPKILVSTVFGEADSSFAKAMQLGNLHRMNDWDRKYLFELVAAAESPNASNCKSQGRRVNKASRKYNSEL